ncbi:MAG: isochorismatase family protein, partial [Thermoanaerobaculia bacterium]
LMKKWWESPILEKDPQSELISDFNFLKEYPIFIKKNYYDAFKETGLKQILKGRGVEKILIGGVLTNCCCETTARSAFMNNFEVFFLFDGTATYKKEYHESTILNISYGFGEILFFNELFPPRNTEENLENQNNGVNLSEE